MLDLKIINATIIDGSGTSPYFGAIGIKNGKIVSIVENQEELEAKETFDALGKYVVPGFVDIHTHTDHSVFIDNRAESQIRQGVTSEVGGLCGGSVVPSSDKIRSKVSGFFGDKITLTWNTFNEYLDCLKENKHSTNIATMIGHGTIRHLAMQDSDPNKTATESEINSMASILEECLQEGAVGMSSGLEYFPGLAASTYELEKLCRVLEKYNAFHAPHVRNRDLYSMLGFTEVIDISRRTGARLQISHLNPKYGRPEKTVERTLELLNWLMDDGVEVGIDIMPTEWNFVNAPSLMPSWFHDLSLEERLEMLNSPSGRAKLKINEKQMWQLAAEDKWDKIRLFTSEKFVPYHGKTIEEIAAEFNCSGFDAYCRLMYEERENMGGVIVTGNAFSREDIITMLKFPYCSVASDSIASAVDGPLQNVCVGPNSYLWSHVFLKEYVEEAGVMSLPEGIRRITSLPAHQARIKDRGLIKVGNFADITVINPKTEKTPFEISNPKKYPANIEAVFVNGQCALQYGKRTENRTGQSILRNN